MSLEDYILQHIEPEPEYLHRLWRATNVHTIHGHMVSGHLQGRLLKMLVQMKQPQNVLEVGTFSGYSAICMAEGLGPEGHVWTFEVNDEMEEFTRPWIENSAVADRITFSIGDANIEAPKLGIVFDMAFIDGDKRTYVESIDFNAKLQSIGAYAFKDCYRVSEMTCLAVVTPDVGTNALSSIDANASLCVPAECLRKYKVDPNWGRFDLCELGSTTTTTDTKVVTVEPTDNTAIFTWPTENNAASYSLQITKDGVVFCTLVFNSNGQLIGIAFAPGRNGASHAPAATMSVAGMSFTVTGLDGASKYAYRLAVTNDASEELVAYSGEFATTGYDGEVNPGGNPEGLNNTPFPSGEGRGEASKILRNGQLFIQRGNELFNAQGARVK